MKYPEPIMRATALEKMGFSRTFLNYAYQRKNQTYAWKMSDKKNSPIVFDTEAFEKWRVQRALGKAGAV